MAFPNNIGPRTRTRHYTRRTAHVPGIPGKVQAPVYRMEAPRG